MASDPSAGDEEFTEFVHMPIRTAGDLSEIAARSAEITTTDVARDLESVASKSGAATES
jgi:hypothetical protein